MTYAELQHRRERIDTAVMNLEEFIDSADPTCGSASGAMRSLIRALLDDTDPKLWSYHPFAPAKMTPKLEWQIETYDRALSIAEKELGL